jgi:uncharacterized SAM-binding protein YcdF (DUF218 family)
MKQRLRRIVRWTGAVTCAVAVAWLFLWLWDIERQVEDQADHDNAQPADVIVVLGAAEYRGRPSPVFEARLNHALFLYLRQQAPRIITTGGAGGDPHFTEGDVGRAYLSRRGVPSEAIFVENEGESTVHSVVAATEIMRKFGWQSCIVVTDGYHMFRTKRMLEERGLRVYGSPRPSSASRDDWQFRWLCWRQALGFGLYRIGINI